MKLLVAAIDAAGYAPGEDIAIALDPASSELYEDGRYDLAGEGRDLTSAELAGYFGDLCARYPIVSIEDGMAEDDWDGWAALTRELGDRVQLVGDDVFVTNPERLQRGIDLGVANSILIKVNQIGTLTETLDTMRAGVEARVHVDDVAPQRRDRGRDDRRPRGRDRAAGRSRPVRPPARTGSAKYNQLLRIEEGLGEAAAFPGGAALARSGPST